MSATPPPPGADLALLRDRRRKRLPVHYRGDFNIATEIRDVCTPAATDISRLKRPRALKSEVREIADAVHEIQFTIVGIISESRSLPDGARARSRQAVSDLAVRPQEPEISDEEIISGSWAAKLARWVAPYSGDLAYVLGRALPPADPRLKLELSVSERVERALRGLDSAVLAAERRVPRAAERQALPSMAEYNAQLQAQADARRAERALSKIGVTR